MQVAPIAGAWIETNKQDYGNGKIYYAYHGQELPNLPSNPIERPSGEYLRWHAEHVYR